ncbi:helix-turn-helix transcriptional regulator [Marinobacter xestospongiae]|uniref:AraC family transcriptional regulator n=1 Tax=Marinobacter xestospongiae TaxID=994319 RepID=A0ABU3VW91_9GAMM|nr:AraC family transcriptional regulator [Marinobacter xestospongiae]MDV2078534.1 AraC family transcriptional regulator [Marinobacter xestospongiae]
MTPDGPFINCEMAAIADLYEQYPLDRQSWLRVFDYTTRQGLRLQERVSAGCYVSIMGHSDALGGDYPEVPSSFFRNRCLVAVLPEDYRDHVVLPAGGRLQAIQLYFPLSDHNMSRLCQSASSPGLERFRELSAGWLTPLTGALAGAAEAIWQCPLRGEARHLWMKAKALEILALLMADPGEPALVDRACGLIRQDLSQTWSITALARALGTNDCYLKQAFRSELGLGVAAWTQQQRMQRARRELTHTDCTITDLALSLGYRHSGHFARVFRRHTGLSPSHYRQHRQSGHR